MAGVRAGLVPIHLCHQIHGLSHLAEALRRSLPPAAGAHGSKRGRFSIGPGCWLWGRAGLGRTAELIDAGEQALRFGVEPSQLGVHLPWPPADFLSSCSAALTQWVETQRAKTQRARTKRQDGAGPHPPVPPGSEAPRRCRQGMASDRPVHRFGSCSSTRRPWPDPSDQLCCPPESSFLAVIRDQRPAKAPRRSNQALSSALRRSTAPAPLLPFSLSSCTARHS